jgi:hypothetical protein
MPDRYRSLKPGEAYWLENTGSAELFFLVVVELYRGGRTSSVIRSFRNMVVTFTPHPSAL